MIPTYLKPATHCPPGKNVIALDAGGTNLRVSRVVFGQDGKAEPGQGKLDTRKIPMPGTHGHLSSEEFFDKLAEVTAPYLEEAAAEHCEIDGIGFCFSYPMTMTENGDGVPLVFSKELDIPEVVGKPVGDGLRKALEKRGVKVPRRIILLNDTVATLLTGISTIGSRMPSKQRDDGKPGTDTYGVEPGLVIGFILGTGLNTAYPETCIPKIKFQAQSEKDAQLIVMESGTYFNRYQGRLDIEFDNTTKNPGAYTTEKACAGAYMGGLTLHIFKQAIREKVLAFAKQEEIMRMNALPSIEVNTFQHSPLSRDGLLSGLFGADEIDALKTMQYLVEIVNERASIFAATLVAGPIRHIGAGLDPHRPVRIAVEGSTFTLYGQMRRSIEAHLHSMLTYDGPRFYNLQTVDQASLIGAAVAALSES
jgi:hexokinase